MATTMDIRQAFEAARPNGSGNAAGGEAGGGDSELRAAEAEIERTRERVASNILAIRREISRRIDWREWVRRYPMTCALGALAIGLLWGGRGRAGGARAFEAGAGGRRRKPWK